MAWSNSIIVKLVQRILKVRWGGSNVFLLFPWILYVAQYVQGSKRIGYSCEQCGTNIGAKQITMGNTPGAWPTSGLD